MRRQIIQWLIKLFKVQEGSLVPKFIRLVWTILNPITAFFIYNKIFRFDIITDSYIIQGIKISREVLENFTHPTPPRQWFRVDQDEFGLKTTIRIIEE